MMHSRQTRQRGIALPIMLIMLTVMLVSSIYLLKSSTSTTLTTANLAYDASLSKAADLGLHTAFAYLRAIPNASLLENNQAGQGLRRHADADLDRQQRRPSGRARSSLPADPGRQPGRVRDPPAMRLRRRVQRARQPLPADLGTAEFQDGCRRTASSGRSDSPNYLDQPQLHYVVTARIVGARGGNVITQAVVMKGP